MACSSRTQHGNDAEARLLLRSDIHTLFDRGWVTITPDHRVEVSSRIRDEFHNEREYYALHGHELRPPGRPDRSLSEDNIARHNEAVYLGA